jgi:hypothetical protein
LEQISIAIPYHGVRSQWTMQTIMSCHNRQQVEEIVICAEPGSDASTIVNQCRARYKKVRVVENTVILGPFLNKTKAVSLCKSAWVALIDSDNIIAAHYLRFTTMDKLNSNKIYCPEQGWPMLKYLEFIGEDIGLARTAQLLDNNNFQMLFNTGNYILHRDTWLKALQPVRNDTFYPHAVDVAWVNYNCLKTGMVLSVVKDCVYKHNVHKNSTYLQTAKQSAEKWIQIQEMIKESVYGNMASPGEVQAKKQSNLSPAHDWSGSGNGNREQADSDKRPDQNGFDLLTN